MINPIPIRILIFLQLITLLVCIQPAFAQEKVMVATYGKKYTGIKIDSTKYSKEVLEMFNEQEKQLSLIMPEVEYQLLFTKTESSFKIVERLGQSKDDLLNSAIMCADGDGISYTNLQTDEKLHQMEFFGKTLLIDINIPQNWNLTNETKKIGQFNCFKATTIRITRNPAGTFRKTVIAWYTTDLPFQHGPIGYGGLPGLIVELSYQNAIYFLKSIDLKPKITLEIEKPTKGKKITLEEYYDMGIEASKNFSFGN